MNYGAGKSKFYAASDGGSHASVSKLLPINPNKDRTLYLSRYFFYSIMYVLLLIVANKKFYPSFCIDLPFTMTKRRLIKSGQSGGIIAIVSG